MLKKTVFSLVFLSFAFLSVPLTSPAPLTRQFQASPIILENRQPQSSFDVILKNGTIIDGTGTPGYQADIGIRDGFIMKIGNLDNAEAANEYDLSGLFVTPGFISLHSHADRDALDTAKNMLMQGVTTEILNADGSGPADIASQLQELEQIDLAINVGATVGFNSVWRETIGMDDRPPTDREFEQMRQRIQNAMQAGAWGVSSGIQYVPGFYASTDEIIQVVKAAKPWRTQYISHIRNEYEKVIQSTKEAVTIGEQAGLTPVITHMKVVGSGNWGETKQTLAILQNARQRGVYVAADVYPYLAGQSSLSILVPAQYQEGGFNTMLKRLQNPELRKKIRQNMAAKIEGKYGGPQNILFPNLGTNLAEVAQKMEQPPGEAAIRLMEREQHSISSILFYGSEEDLNRLLKNPFVAVSCDCGSTTDSSTHPRHYGSWPKVLGRFVREQNLIPWEEAIRKMTGLPATILGMTQRGFITEGMFADITVFDPETIIDHATYRKPKQYAEGIKYVFINGKAALEQGEISGIQAGSILRHGPHMPTRPMGANNNIKISGSGTIDLSDGPVEVSFEVSQIAGDGKGNGYFEFSDASNDMHVSTKSDGLGMVQATNLWGDGWASFTGTVLVEGETKPLLVILEENAPLDSSKNSMIYVWIGDEYKISGAMDVQMSLNAKN